MVYGELIKYIKEGQKRGYSLAELKVDLLNAGWSNEEIDLAAHQFKKTKKSKPDFIFKANSKIFIMGFLIFILVCSIFLIFVLNDTQKKISLEEWEEGNSFDLIRKSLVLEDDENEIEISPQRTFQNYTKIKINNKSYSLDLGKEIKIDTNGDQELDFLIRLEQIQNKIPKLYLQKFIPLKKDLAVSNNESTSKQNKTNETIAFEENPPIIQNETDIDCIEDWDCSDWSQCIDLEQERTCEDLNDCGTIEDRPSLERSCEIEENITSNLTNQEICMQENENYSFYNESFECVSHYYPSVINITYENQTISCCKGESVSSPEEFCETKNQIYFNSSYSCNSYGIYDFFDEEINCCFDEPFLKFERTTEFNDSWNSLNISGYCNYTFSEKIRNCTQYKCNYVHPFDGENYSMGVVLDKEDICHTYLESMMDSYEYCKINSSFLPQYADYYANFTQEDYMGVGNFTISTGDSGDPQNAKEIAYENGDCQYIF